MKIKSKLTARLKNFRKESGKRRKIKESFFFNIEKRQRFLIAVFFLTAGLIYAEFTFSRLGIFISFLLAALTSLFSYWGLGSDLKDKKSYQVFILPFFYSLSFVLFSFLTPNFVYRIILAIIYAIGLYSLFLSQNIFIVSSTRTIALLTGARIVSFVITLVSFFLLTNVIFTLHLVVFPILALVIIYSYFLFYHSIWSYTLQKNSESTRIWVLVLTLSIAELALILWFWQSRPAIIALFLTGYFYILIGLSHIWFEKRFFKGVLWEYVWIGLAAIISLFVFS